MYKKQSFVLWLIVTICFGLLGGGPVFASEDEFPQSEFVVNISNEIPEWRPHLAYNADEAQILSAVCEGLFVYDPYNLDPLPALAESWTVSKDNCEWTFKIRKNARFSNGDPITAETFRNSWLALLDPALNAPYASLFDVITGVSDYRTGKNADPGTVGITAPDSNTLVVDLVSPAPHLSRILCHHAFCAVHPSVLALEKSTTLPADFIPISSGAYMISSISDTEIKMIRNPTYWDIEHVYLPSIKFIVGDDARELTDRFNRGEIHWLAGSSVLDRVIDSSSIHITPLFATEYFFFRTTWGPWADSRIRNALLLAVPWTELRANYLIPAKTLVFPIAGYPEISGINTQNVSEAKAKLTEAGITDPASLIPLVISIPDSDSFKALAAILEKGWTELGITVKVQVFPYAVYYDSLKKNDYAIGITSWIGDFADPLSFLELFRSSSSLNDSGWKSKEYESLITEASAMLQTKERYAKLAEAEKILLADAVVLPVAHNPALNIIDTNGLTGWYTNALDIHPFKFIRFSQKKALPGVALQPPADRLYCASGL